MTVRTDARVRGYVELHERTLPLGSVTTHVVLWRADTAPCGPFRDVSVELEMSCMRGVQKRQTNFRHAPKQTLCNPLTVHLAYTCDRPKPTNEKRPHPASHLAMFEVRSKTSKNNTVCLCVHQSGSTGALRCMCKNPHFESKPNLRPSREEAEHGDRGRTKDG